MKSRIEYLFVSPGHLVTDGPDTALGRWCMYPYHTASAWRGTEGRYSNSVGTNRVSLQSKKHHYNGNPILNHGYTCTSSSIRRLNTNSKILTDQMSGLV